MNKHLKFLFILSIFGLIPFVGYSVERQRVNINSNPSGAQYKIENDVNNYTTPNSQRFNIGYIYHITFSSPGYKTKTITYKGGSGDIMVNLESEGPTSYNYSLSVTANVNGATVFINGNQKGQAPLNLSLPQGNYNIQVKANGYSDFNTSINLNSNQTVNAVLTSINRSLTVNANVNGAKVFINGQSYGQTPMTISLPPGVYNLQVKYPGYKDYTTSVNLNSDQAITANLEPNRFISIKLPKGAKIFINGNKKEINWGHGRGEDWKIFTFYEAAEWNKIKVEYYDLTIEKSVNFNNSTITLTADLN